MLLNGYKSIIARLTFSLWLSVLIFALPNSFGYAGMLTGFIFFPYYFEAPLLYFIKDLAFAVPSSNWTPYVFWQTVLALITLAIVIEVKSWLFKFN